MIAAETETQSFGYASAFFAPFADVRTVLCPWPIASSGRSDLARSVTGHIGDPSSSCSGVLAGMPIFVRRACVAGVHHACITHGLESFSSLSVQRVQYLHCLLYTSDAADE